MNHINQSAFSTADDPLSDVISLAPEAQDALERLVAALNRAKDYYRSIAGSDDYARIEKLSQHAFEAHAVLCLGMLSDEHAALVQAKAVRRLAAAENTAGAA